MTHATKTTTTTHTAQTFSGPTWLQILENAIDQPGTVSDAYSAFWNYSMGNQIAALMACMARGIEPGPIATFAGWHEKGRFVKKGEKAIWLCMPITSKRTEQKEDGTTEVHGFTRFVWKPRWFVLSQTQGADYSKEAAPGWDRAKALAALDIAEQPFTMTDGNCQGYANGRTIAINPVAKHAARTTFHELAHVVLGHTAEGPMSDSDRTPRDEREMEAEGVAYLLGQALGLPGVEEARGYIQHWAHGKRFSERMAQRIFSAAGKILKAGQPTASNDNASNGSN